MYFAYEKGQKISNAMDFGKISRTKEKHIKLFVLFLLKFSKEWFFRLYLTFSSPACQVRCLMSNNIVLLNIYVSSKNSECNEFFCTKSVSRTHSTGKFD
jgi:hypothetical protein